MYIQTLVRLLFDAGIWPWRYICACLRFMFRCWPISLMVVSAVLICLLYHAIPLTRYMVGLRIASNYYSSMDYRSVNEVKDGPDLTEMLGPQFLNEYVNHEDAPILPSEMIKSYLGEDLSLRCQVPLRYVFSNSSQSPDQITWLHTQNYQNVEELEGSRAVMGEGYLISQIDIIGLKKTDFGLYWCLTPNKYLLSKHFTVTEIKPEAIQMNLPPGSLVEISLAVNLASSSSSSIDAVTAGVEINGKTHHTFDNFTRRCSPHLIAATGNISYVNIFEDPFSTNINKRRSLPYLNDFKKWTTNLKFCTDQLHYGVYQVYFKLNGERNRIYHPISWVIKPNFFNGFLMGFYQELNKDIRSIDLKDLNFLKKEMKIELERESGIGLIVTSNLNEQFLIWRAVRLLTLLFVVLFLWALTKICIAGFRFIYYSIKNKTNLYVEDNRSVYVLCSDVDIFDSKKTVLLPLEQNDIKVWISQRDAVPGSFKIDETFSAINRSFKLIIFLTENLTELQQHYFREILVMIVEKTISKDTMILFKPETKYQIKHVRTVENISPIPYDDIWKASWEKKLVRWIGKKNCSSSFHG